jgi:hypothetical protein
MTKLAHPENLVFVRGQFEIALGIDHPLDSERIDAEPEWIVPREGEEREREKTGLNWLVCPWS